MNIVTRRSAAALISAAVVSAFAPHSTSAKAKRKRHHTYVLVCHQEGDEQSAKVIRIRKKAIASHLSHPNDCGCGLAIGGLPVCTLARCSQLTPVGDPCRVFPNCNTAEQCGPSCTCDNGLCRCPREPRTP